ncbi:hypothetical protein DL93DRAFT_831826 [Clavulina sp. PMI_390]|nr:hypothetical protein DL93DRAFT_831826 [Clavulina sp. PMI_390]
MPSQGHSNTVLPTPGGASDHFPWTILSAEECAQDSESHASFLENVFANTPSDFDAAVAIEARCQPSLNLWPFFGPILELPSRIDLVLVKDNGLHHPHIQRLHSYIRQTARGICKHIQAIFSRAPYTDSNARSGAGDILGIRHYNVQALGPCLERPTKPKLTQLALTRLQFSSALSLLDSLLSLHSEEPNGSDIPSPAHWTHRSPSPTSHSEKPPAKSIATLLKQARSYSIAKANSPWVSLGKKAAASGEMQIAVEHFMFLRRLMELYHRMGQEDRALDLCVVPPELALKETNVHVYAGLLISPVYLLCPPSKNFPVRAYQTVRVVINDSMPLLDTCSNPCFLVSISRYRSVAIWRPI